LLTRTRLAEGILVLLSSCISSVALAQGAEGCASEPIRARFEPFLKTGVLPAELRAWMVDPKAQYVEPYQAFDNVWFVGVCWVSAWAVRTSEGVVLIDTLHDPFTDRLLDNLKKVGIQPADIKYVLVTHGHFDHAGGAYKLKPLTQAKFVMTQRGWDEALAASKQVQGTPRAWTMIAQEMTLKDGDTIKLGDSTFTLYETPGHTLGTASYAFTVRDGTKSYRAFTVGGLGLNTIRDSKQVEDYIASVTRVAQMVKDPVDPVTVHLTTHPFSNDLTEAKDKLRGRKPNEPHPLVDPSGFLKQLEELRLGAEERLVVERKAGR
jgi:metallo-beta-lactamase class B